MFNSEALKRWSSGTVDVTIDCDLRDVSKLVPEIVSKILPGDWIFLNGDLGSGKTTFCQLMMKEFGYTGEVTSPTYTLLNVMNIPDISCAVRKVCHLDLYRLKTPSELVNLGLEIEFSASAICLFEWAEVVVASGWSQFFQSTQCRRPKRLLEISISNPVNVGQRRYSLGWRKLIDSLGIPDPL